MARQTIVLFSCLAAALLAIGPLLAQNNNQAAAPRPELQPGDKLEVLDMGRLREAEFVEFTPVGLIKVRFEDDSQLAFRPTHVRFAKGINPREPKLTAKLPEKLIAKLPAAKEAARAAAAAATPPADELKINRKWQDASGQFSIEAEFVTLQEGKVELKKPDGKIISVPLDKLAAADQEIARKLATAANPFEQNVTELKPPPVKMTTLSISLSEAKKFEYTDDVTWSVTADPAPTIKNIPTAPIFVPSENKHLFVQNRPLFDTGNGWAWFHLERTRDSAYLERIDLLGRRQLARIPFPLQSDLFSVSPSGKWLALRLHALHTPNLPTDFQLWKINGQDVQPAITLTPFTRELNVRYGGFEHNRHDEISEAEFIDDNHLFITTPHGSALVDLQTGKGVYTIVSPAVTFSPNKRYFVAYVYQHHVRAGEVSKNGWFVIESLTGRFVGKLDLGGGEDSPSMIAFRSDGMKLAARGKQTIWLWDLPTGQLETSWRGVELDTRLDSLSFGSHENLILGGKYCFNVRDGVMSAYIWWPNGSDEYLKYLADFQGRSWFYAARLSIIHVNNRNNGVGIASFLLPGDTLNKAYEEVDVSDLLLIKPGARFNLSFQGLPPEMADDFRAKHSVEFKEKGWTLVEPGEAADFEVTYTIENAPAVERTYLRTRDTSNPVKVMTYPQTIKMQFKKRGEEKVLWSRQSSFEAMPSGYLHNNETIEQASLLIRDWKFFEKSRIPQRMMKFPSSIRAVIQASPDAQGRLVVKKAN